MAAKGEKKDYFSVPEDLRDQLYYSDATIWLEPGGVDRTYKAGTPHEAESPWGTQPGKFELRPIPNGSIASGRWFSSAASKIWEYVGTPKATLAPVTPVWTQLSWQVPPPEHNYHDQNSGLAEICLRF